MTDRWCAPLGRVATRRIEQRKQTAFLWPSTGPRARGFEAGEEIAVTDIEPRRSMSYPVRILCRVVTAEKLKWTDLTHAHAEQAGATDLEQLETRWDSCNDGVLRSTRNPHITVVVFDMIKRVRMP
jgi:hypothetical protein